MTATASPDDHPADPGRRDNDRWLADLRKAGPAQSNALAELRILLLRGLRKGIGGRAGNDEAFLEDATQDALILITGKLDQFEGRCQFVTWCVSIAVRTAISALRRKHWKDVTIGHLADGDERQMAFEPAAAEEEAPENKDERLSVLSAMQIAIDNVLTEKQRIALLAEMKGMPMERIAEQMDSNRNAIYKLTHDARKKLKQALESRGYDERHLRSTFA